MLKKLCEVDSDPLVENLSFGGCPLQYVVSYILLGLMGFWTLSIVWYSKEHNVLENVSVSVLRLGSGKHRSVGSVRNG
jgi:hypothetical protein